MNALINAAASADRPDPLVFFAYSTDISLVLGGPACGSNPDPACDQKSLGRRRGLIWRCWADRGAGLLAAATGSGWVARRRTAGAAGGALGWGVGAAGGCDERAL